MSRALRQRKKLPKVVEAPFWETKTLQDMSPKEWESLCDGCGKCCLHTFIDDDEAEEVQATDHIREDEEILYTNIVCRYLNDKSCACTQYDKRTTLVPTCVQLTKDNLSRIFFMPKTCAYRRLYEGKSLPSWHPLRHKGKKGAMHKAGMSVRGKVEHEDDNNMHFIDEHIVTWPLNELD